MLPARLARHRPCNGIGHRVAMRLLAVGSFLALDGESHAEGRGVGPAFEEVDLTAEVACGFAGEPETQATGDAGVAATHPGAEDEWGDVAGDGVPGVGDKNV